MEPDELLSYADAYTPPERCAVHVHGWREYPATGELVTVVPLVDTETNLFARPSYEGLLAVAAREDARLLTTGHVDGIHRTGTKLRAPLMPDAQLKAERPRRQGEGVDDWMDRLRAEGMGSLRWALQLDRSIWAQLGAAEWTGDSLVSNGWKDWVEVPGLPATKSANYGFFDPKAPYVGGPEGRLWQQLGTRHNRRHWDYSQLGRLRKLKARKLDDVPAGSVALAVVAFVLEQCNAKPPIVEIVGAKHHPAISGYLSRCRRGGSPLAGMPGPASSSGSLVGLVADETEWCAAGRSAAVCKAFGETARPAPHGYRCACWEHLADARALGTYRDARSDYKPKPGDGAYYKRNGQDPRNPGQQGHVRTVTWVGGSTYEAAGGNEGNAWKRGIYRFDAEDLVAWVET